MDYSNTKKSLAFFAFLRLTCIFFPAFSFGQYFTIDTVKGESPYNSQFNFIFPHVSNTANPEAANEINQYLVKDILNMELGQQKRSIFENIWGTKELDIAAVSDISYKVINNDADFFCISVSATSCGAHCDDWTRYYIGESKSGRKIALDELLSKEGLLLMADSIQILKTNRIEARVAVMKDKVDNKPLSPDDKNDYIFSIGQYNECNRSINIEHANYSLDKKQLTIYADHCLPHLVKAFDDVDYHFVFDLNSLKGYLTDYGKSLLKL